MATLTRISLQGGRNKTFLEAHIWKYQGVKVWNSIPVEIQNLPKSRFKIKLKSHLMQAYLKEIN